MRFIPLFLLLCLVTALVTPAKAQIAESVFRNYADYQAFVDKHSKARDITKLLNGLGGSDEYTPEQMANLQSQVDNLFKADFEHVAIFNRADLGGGFSHEGRAYWNGLSYLYIYVLLHQREDALVVVHFSFNTSISKIMDRF